MAGRAAARRDGTGPIEPSVRRSRRLRVACPALRDAGPAAFEWVRTKLLETVGQRLRHPRAQAPPLPDGGFRPASDCAGGWRAGPRPLERVDPAHFRTCQGRACAARPVDHDAIDPLDRPETDEEPGVVGRDVTSPSFDLTADDPPAGIHLDPRA